MKLDRLAAKILKLLGRQDAVLDVFLLPHSEIKALKARFIKKQTEPNVLAFREPQSFPHPEMSKLKEKRNKKYLGEIYLNKDILKKSPERAAPLLLHGILHLLGYDHKKKTDVLKMEALEGKMLAALRE